jgi:hypothetical protein
MQKQSTWGKVLLLSCDECKTHFEREYQKFQADKQFHFCSRPCLTESKKKGGVLFEKVTSDCIEKYGVENPFQRDDIKEKSRRTLSNHYGKDIINPSQVKEIRLKIINTCIKKYGVDHQMKCESVRNKTNATLFEKYGVQNAFTLAHIRGTAIRSFENESVRKTAQEAKRLAGKVYVSKVESLFLDRLVNLFGEKNIRRQEYINGRSVDGYVTDKELYIQFDGSHYHGLNKKSLVYENVRSKVIGDRIQDEWFFKNEIHLLRISDKIALTISDDDLTDLVIYSSKNESFVTYAFGDVEIPNVLEISH